jgi:hypothetical protein
MQQLQVLNVNGNDAIQARGHPGRRARLWTSQQVAVQGAVRSSKPTGVWRFFTRKERESSVTMSLPLSFMRGAKLLLVGAFAIA